MTETTPRIHRRRFLQQAGIGVGLFHIVPAHVLGGPKHRAPSDKLNVACIGVGGRGGASVRACKDENIIALCDVDDKRAAKSYEQFPSARRYRDFREMLDALDKDIDAVTVGTPDHTHAVAALDAIRRGKHVYCEKPLAHSIHEVRALMDAARKQTVVTQLGNQGHSFDDIRTFCEWIRDGAIGNVKEIHACCESFGDVFSQIDKLPQLAEKHDVPAGLDYDLWLGPAQFRPYSPLWVPWKWRGWLSFGTGCIGDMFCHTVDPTFWALDLGSPTTVRAEVEGYDPKKHADTYPPATRITFEFAAKRERGPVKLVWFDGKARPPRPPELEAGKGIPSNGAIVYGDRGTILHDSHGATDCRIIPEAKMKEYQPPPQTLPRVENHHRDWLDAIRSGGKAGSDFHSYGGPLTEVALVGAVAIRFPGRELEWDAKAMQFTNLDEANAYVAPPYREGWSL